MEAIVVYVAQYIDEDTIRELSLASPSTNATCSRYLSAIYKEREKQRRRMRLCAHEIKQLQVLSKVAWMRPSATDRYRLIAADYCSSARFAGYHQRWCFENYTQWYLVLGSAEECEKYMARYRLQAVCAATRERALQCDSESTDLQKITAFECVAESNRRAFVIKLCETFVDTAVIRGLYGAVES
jgi:hypothetical protein